MANATSTTSKNLAFTPDAFSSLSEGDAKRLLPEYEEAVTTDIREDLDRGVRTTHKAAYMTGVAIKSGLLKVGKGGKKIEGSITQAEYGQRISKMLGGAPVSQSTVGLWVNLSYLACGKVKGFDMANERHATLFRALTGKGGTASIVTEAIRADKASVAKIEKAHKLALNPPKKEETPASTDTHKDEDGHKDDEGNPAPVGNVRSAIEQVLGALVLIQEMLGDVSVEDFPKVDRAWTKVGQDVSARRDSIADMVEKSDESAKRTASARKTA
jgi:hypothetical protein